MGPHFVFVLCRLDRRDGKSALIEDADGWPRKVVGPLGRVDGRLVVAGRWLREANGRHLVWFGDGSRVWVTQGPGSPEDFAPLGWPPRSGPPAAPPPAADGSPAPAAAGPPPQPGPFAEVVRGLAAEAGNVYRLAKAAGVTQTALWGITRGRRPRPSARLLGKLLAATGKPWAWLDEVLEPAAC
jgi:hypothetical protein